MTTTFQLSINHHRHGRPVTITGTVQVEINDKGIAEMIATRALQNSSGKASLLNGGVKATVLAWEAQPA